MHQQPIYFGTTEEKLFGWYHRKVEAEEKDCAVIICAPIGHEFIHAHRSLRHLAQKLADQGIPTLRFDYHGVGNSPGSDSDSNRTERWSQDIKSAINYLRQISGRKKICLIGLRLGANLALRISAEQDINYLILWAPIINGKRYIREMQAIAMDFEAHKNNQNDGIEVAGFVMTNETIECLKKINLLEQNFKVKDRLLLVHRDDLQLDQSFLLKLKNEQIPFDEIQSSGYSQMMAEPHFNEVPDITLNQISAWLIKNTKIDFNKKNIRNQEYNYVTSVKLKEDKFFYEEAYYFGKNKDLFGIISYLDPPKNDKPLIVFLNSGSVYHIGPNRLYVTLARNLTNAGFSCFRMDLHGLGESGLSEELKENNPYPDWATSDTEEALSFLKKQFGQYRFILIGLCSGAHHAFHSSIEMSSQFEIIDTVLINPLTYRWKEGMSLHPGSNSTNENFQKIGHYKKSMRQRSKWLKLIKGNIQFRQIFHILLIRIQDKINGFFDFSKTTELSKDIEKILRKNSTLTLVISETDPGFEMLIEGAKKLVKKEMKSKKIRVNFIQSADHTFSVNKHRIELINKLLKILN